MVRNSQYKNMRIYFIDYVECSASKMCIRDRRIALEENYDAAFLLNQDAWVEKKTIGTLLKLCRKSVSYTHLDVYKRQLLNFTS